ncbi:glycosyl hydrolase family 28-related protein [Geminisphaera colitermitum]|uniref:glycosyl hydrolase family 28-related protein n=1 Tax=Geminisphaera colitermitum TaxID=1148786 RepID=UPI000158D2D5|nr:glycosyl hydrolase family 28-related protein [Geminisphaera colitermitum]
MTLFCHLPVLALAAALATALHLASAEAPPTITEAIGADTPWTTHTTATANAHRGKWLASRKHGDIANESITRRCLRLSDEGDYIEWRVTRPANAIVIRHSIPDAPDGGGIRATLTLLVNGQQRQKLALDSRHAWLYGPKENAQDNNPAAGGTPHRFFDDARALITGPDLQPGDTIRIQKNTTNGDTAPWYVIDLIDLEHVAPPPSPPPDALSITDFGATPDDGSDDTSAIETAIARARELHRPVWLPPGTYHQSRQIKLPGVTLIGAGPWHTRLIPTGPATDAMGFPGNAGFRLAGTGAQIRDLMIEGNSTARTKPRQHGFSSDSETRDFTIDNVWIEHVKTGMWLGSCANGIIRRTRVRNTYADGINLNNTSRSITIEHSHLRNTGDDALASFSNSGGRGTDGPCTDIVFRHNTIESPWWAHGIGIYGGTRITIEQNLIYGVSRAPGIKIAASSFHGKNDWPGDTINVTRNILADCGGTSWGQRWGALWLYTASGDLTHITIGQNQIHRPAHDAIKIQGGAGTLDATLTANTIATNESADLVIAANARGHLRITDSPKLRITNHATPDAFVIAE